MEVSLMVYEKQYLKSEHLLSMTIRIIVAHFLGTDCDFLCKCDISRNSKENAPTVLSQVSLVANEHRGFLK